MSAGNPITLPAAPNAPACLSIREGRHEIAYGLDTLTVLRVILVAAHFPNEGCKTLSARTKSDDTVSPTKLPIT